MSCIAGLFLSLAVCAVAPEEASVAGPFAGARLAPSDVAAFIHVDNAASIRKELADRPIAQWLTAIFKSGEFRQAWNSLSKAAQCDNGQLFDLLLGRQFTIVIRDASQWTLITNVPSAAATKFVQVLRVRILAPKAGMAISELPEQELLIARDDSTLVIGPTKHAELFYEMLPRLNEQNGDSLASHPGIVSAKELGSGVAGVFVRHAAPLGGWSVAVADLKGDHLTIQHAAHFDNSPFNHGITKLECDFSRVTAFDRLALVAIMQPTDVGDGPVESFLTASLGEGLISPQMRANLGKVRMLVVGEEDARLRQKPEDLLCPSLVSCLEVNDRGPALQQLDQAMVKLTMRLNKLSQGTMLKQPADAIRLPPTGPREVDLSPAAEWFGGGFPIMKGVSLNWTVVNGPNSAWFVIGSHRQSLNDVVGVLQKECPRDPRFVGRFDSCGSCNGLRLGGQLRSFSEAADKFAEPEKAEDFRLTLRMMSDLAGGLQNCRWQLARPTANDMRLNVQVTLSAPESSRVDSATK